MEARGTAAGIPAAAGQKGVPKGCLDHTRTFANPLASSKAALVNQEELIRLRMQVKNLEDLATYRTEPKPAQGIAGTPPAPFPLMKP